MSEMDQESDIEPLKPHAAAIVQPAIMNHRDKVALSCHPQCSSTKDVKLLAGCCMADALRLFAPDAPYSNDELLVWGF